MKTKIHFILIQILILLLSGCSHENTINTDESNALSSQYEQLINEAVLLIKNHDPRDYTEAAQILSAINEGAGNADSVAYECFCYIQMGNLLAGFSVQAAESYFVRANELLIEAKNRFPTNKKIEMMWGYFYFYTGNTRLARGSALDANISLQYNPLVLFLMWLTTDNQNVDSRYILAIRSIDDSWAMIHLTLGITCESQAKIALAKDYFIKAQTIDHDNPITLIIFGNYYIRNGEPDRGRILLSNAMENTDNPDIIRYIENCMLVPDEIVTENIVLPDSMDKAIPADSVREEWQLINRLMQGNNLQYIVLDDEFIETEQHILHKVKIRVFPSNQELELYFIALYRENP